MEEQILETDNQENIIYPEVSERIKAAVTDSFVIIAFMTILTIFGSWQFKVGCNFSPILETLSYSVELHDNN